MSDAPVEPRWPKILSLSVHEFRTPMTVVAGYIRMLLKDRAGPLSDQQRACIVLRYAAQLDTAGIASALGTSEGTVRVQLHRAHATLRRTLKEADDG